MPKSQRIIFVTYPGAEILDITGPSSVFSTADRISNTARYRCIIASAHGGLVPHSGGITLDTRALHTLRLQPQDTLLVPGGSRASIEQAISEGIICPLMAAAADKVKRYGSVCTGTFLLGAAGLLDGKNATTHWAARKALGQLYATSRIDFDSLYVQHDRLWSSAGVSTGIDMALAMLAQDHDYLIRSKVAKLLVVYSHRPGRQSQFSQLLAAQTRVDEHFNGLVDWLVENLQRPPKVEAMARFVSMSPRSFSRKFKLLFDISPGKFLEQLRLDQARQLLECGEQTKTVAHRIGFNSEAAFRSAFREAFGVTPGHYAQMHATQG